MMGLGKILVSVVITYRVYGCILTEDLDKLHEYSV